MRSRCMSLLPRTTLHSDSEQRLWKPWSPGSAWPAVWLILFRRLYSSATGASGLAFERAIIIQSMVSPIFAWFLRWNSQSPKVKIKIMKYKQLLLDDLTEVLYIQSYILKTNVFNYFQIILTQIRDNIELHLLNTFLKMHISYFIFHPSLHN